MGSYNKAMIKNSTIIDTVQLIETLSMNEPIILTCNRFVRAKSLVSARLITTQDGEILATGCNKDTGHNSF